MRIWRTPRLSRNSKDKSTPVSIDDTPRPLKFGEGTISGYLSVALGVLSVLGVLCFRFPDLLTTPSLRTGYDVEKLRWLLAAGMVFSTGFGFLRRRWLLSLSQRSG